MRMDLRVNGERAAELYRKGLSVPVIAKRLGHTRKSVISAITKHGISITPEEMHWDASLAWGVPQGAAGFSGNRSLPHFVEHSGNGDGSVSNLTCGGFFNNRERK